MPGFHEQDDRRRKLAGGRDLRNVLSAIAKHALVLVGAFFLSVFSGGCFIFGIGGDEAPAGFQPADRPLLEYLDLSFVDLRDCAGVLDQATERGLTFRDIARTQQLTFEELKKAKATDRYVDALPIYDELLDLFWDAIPIPRDLITGGVIDAYGTQAVKALWEIKESLQRLETLQVAGGLAKLFAAILEVAQDKMFLANQTAIYMYHVSVRDPAVYKQDDFVMVKPFDEFIHEEIWTEQTESPFGGQDYLTWPSYLNVAHPANPDRFTATFVKWITKDAWNLAHANYLLQQDKAALREQILLACEELARQKLQWRVSPVWHGDIEGLSDDDGHLWWDSEFDDSAWEPIPLPDEDSFPDGTDRFYRTTFELDDPDSFPRVLFASDDGLLMYVNSEIVGRWGAEWREAGCVNDPRGLCFGGTMAGPVEINSHLHKGTNVIAVRVSNGRCCNSDFAFTTVP